jgi:DNA polymerase
MDDKFKVHGAGITVPGRPSVWVPAKYLPDVLNRLDLPNNAMVGHNLHFDGSIMAWKYGILPKLYIDTLALSRALLGQHLARHGLTYVAEFLCGVSKFPGFLTETRGVRDLPPDMEQRLAKYCVGVQEGNYAGDCELTLMILKRLLPYMPYDELLAQDWSIRIFTDPKIFLDEDMLWQYHREVVESKQNILKTVGLDNRDTLMSADKYADALRTLGVEPPTKITAKGVRLKDQGVQPTLENKGIGYACAKTDPEHKDLLEHDDSRVQALVAARLEVKSTIEETRSIKYARAAQYGPWPVHLNASGAKNTHRFSGGSGGGGNPQNWKRGGTIRDSIYAPEGKVIIVPDLSQIEARITLWLGSHMSETNMEMEALAKLLSGEDIYSWFGSHIYGMEITKSTHPYERQVSKSGVLGLGFGMGEERLIAYARGQGVNDMTPELALRVKQLYRAMFTGVKAFWKACDKQLLPAMMEGYECVLPNSQHPIIFSAKDIMGSPAIGVPGGLQIKYPDLDRGEHGWSYRDGNSRVKLFGGKVTENIVQCIAGRILRTIILKINTPGVIDVWTNVHDEAPALIDETPDITEYLRLKAYNNSVPKAERVPNPLPENDITRRITAAFTETPSFMPGLPLGVEYDFGYRYGDCK